MRAKTISEFFIWNWLRENFRTEKLEIAFLSPDTARIRDKNEGIAYVKYKNGYVFLDQEA